VQRGWYCWRSAIGLILLQNWSPSLSLILFGSETLALPLAVWLGLGIAAGIATSLIVQLLNYLPSASPREINPEVAPRYREKSGTKRRTRPPGKSDWEIPPSTDWNPLPEDDGGWRIDEPPAAATIPQTDAPQSDLRKNARTTPRNPPPQDRPSQPAGTNSTSTKPSESPSPKEATGTPPQSKDGIYDANYRVINPPNAEDSQPTPENEEKWDF
jgi:hypothetical protein